MTIEKFSNERIRKVWQEINPDWFNEIFRQESEMGKRIADKVQTLLPYINFPSIDLLQEVYQFRQDTIVNNLDEDLGNISLFVRSFRLVRIEEQLFSGLVVDTPEERMKKALPELTEVFLSNGMFLPCFWGADAKKLTGEKTFWVMRPMFAIAQRTEDYFCFYKKAKELFSALERTNEWDFNRIKSHIMELKTKYSSSK